MDAIGRERHTCNIQIKIKKNMKIYGERHGERCMVEQKNNSNNIREVLNQGIVGLVEILVGMLSFILL